MVTGKIAFSRKIGMIKLSCQGNLPCKINLGPSLTIKNCSLFFIQLFKIWSFGPVANPATRGSEIFGYTEGGSYLNPKHEIRNPKRFGRLTALSNVEGQYRMIQIRMIKTRPWRYKFKHYV